MGGACEGGVFVEVRVEEVVHGGACAETEEGGAGLEVGNASVET